MSNRLVAILLVATSCLLCERRAAEESPAWTRAHAAKKPMTGDETRAFMKRLARFVAESHLKKSENSPQRGMIYEYLDMRRRGQFDQFVQGEALDTMHDGAWFGAALVSAYRATGDRYYYDLLTGYVLPFYCKVLNNSDALFANARDDAAKDAHRFNDKEHQLIPGEKGFCPYWWDDGNSISLERRLKKQPLGVFACTDNLAGKENPQYRLDGFSHGCSNHMAQDLGVLLMQSWLLLKDQKDDPAAAKLAADVKEAAKNLYASRVRRGYFIPAVAAPLAAMGDEEIRKRLPDPNNPKLYEPSNHYTRAMQTFKPGQRYSLPGFADDQEYLYHAGIARAAGQLPKPLAFKLIYDAYTQPLLYRAYSDDAPVPPGINVFDLHPYYFKDGKPEDYRSDRKGPHKKPRPIGSRFGPQNMVVSGWALMALREHPGVWTAQQGDAKASGNPLAKSEANLGSALQHELSAGLRTWEAIFDEFGYIPSGIGTGNHFDHFSDSGGYAHLLKAASMWLMYLEGRTDWPAHNIPPAPG